MYVGQDHIIFRTKTDNDSKRGNNSWMCNMGKWKRFMTISPSKEGIKHCMPFGTDSYALRDRCSGLLCFAAGRCGKCYARFSHQTRLSAGVKAPFVIKSPFST
jgi:hypothetical protein